MSVEIGIRFKYFREEVLKMKNMKSFVEDFKVGQSSISRIETEGKGLDLGKVDIMINKYRLNPIWLITGKGSPQLDKNLIEEDKTFSEPIVNYDSNYNIIKKENEMLHQMLKQKEEEVKFLRELLGKKIQNGTESK